MAYTTFARTDVESTPTAKLSSRLLPRTGPVARLAMPEPPVGQTGGLSSTANLAYGLRASNERLRPQPSRPAPAAAPPAAAVVEEASTIIQAAEDPGGVESG